MNENLVDSTWQLGSDLPVVNPADDAFGYATFASQLADAIVNNKSPRGLVLAVHGKWGSGKSSLLNFIKFDLNQLPENKRPILIDFNPWWFDGRDQIARQLIEQFSSQLPDNLKQVKSLAKIIGKYSQQIADAAADVSGFSWLKKPLSFLLGWLPFLKFLSTKTDIPSIKKEIEKAIKNSKKRFVFFVDDIDRLTPDEVCDFFRAIKALADFPEVIYVLFFDREEVSRALAASLKIDGEAYLEKIVQAPFHLPSVDKELLYQKLFKGLDSIIESKSLPFTFDQNRWAQIFSDGLSHWIKKPRDIIRTLNAISVTYPSVTGEVNPVDFIALEFIRIFEPTVYETIRDSKEAFCGLQSQIEYKKKKEINHFENWSKTLQVQKRDQIVLLIGRIFPKVAQSLENGHISNGDYNEWRKELRPCNPECFDVYFQFGVPLAQVSRSELEYLISRESAAEISALLIEAKEIIFPDGHSKARDLIERLKDFDSLNRGQASNLIEALVFNGYLLLQKHDESGGTFTLPNRWRISGLIQNLLSQLPPSEGQSLLLRLAILSPDLWCLVNLANDAIQAKTDPSKATRAMINFDSNFVDEFTKIVADRLNNAKLEELLRMPELDFIVYRWAGWGNANTIKDRFEPMLENDDRLMTLLDKFVRTGTRYSDNEVTETYQLSFKALAYAIDVQHIAPRIREIQSQPNLNIRQQTTVNKFIRSLQRMSNGQNPDDFFDD